MVDWLVARRSMAHRNAKEWVRVARALEDLPAIAGCYSEGRLSVDQLVPLTKLATGDTDQTLAEQASCCVDTTTGSCTRGARASRVIPKTS
jgi:hypothetical protein